MQERESILFEHNPSLMWMYEIETMKILEVNEAATIKQIHDPGDRVQLQVSSGSVRLNINQAMPSALILNEALLNAFEHGFGEYGEGTSSINIECTRNRIHIEVLDNGRRLSADFH